MRKLLSAILAAAMLLTSVPSALAQESEPIGEYNSLRLPVVNEVKSEDKVSSYNSEMSLFSLEKDDRPSASAGGGGGGGGAGGATTDIDGFVRIDNIPAQTENKGDMLRIENFKQYVPSALTSDFDGFFDEYNIEYYQDLVIAVFEKSGKKQLMYEDVNSTENHQLSWGFLTHENEIDLCIPVPKELENGTYNVTCYQIPYSKSNYSGLVASLSLSVTDADSSNENPYNSKKEIGFKDNQTSILEGNYKQIGFSLCENVVMPDPSWNGADISGFAVSEQGKVYRMDGYLDAETNEVRPYDAFMELPSGKYTCYFYPYANMFEEGTEIANTVFGPAILNINDIEFDKQYFSAKGNQQNTYVYFSDSIAETLPPELENEAVTVTMNFKDTSGNTMHTISNLETKNFHISSWDAYFELNLNFIGFKPGTYNVEMTLYDEAGTAYELGSTAINITDKSIINYVSILNYSGTLTTSTQYFYVELEMNDMVLDYDKININLLNEGGDVVAETVSKELRDINYDNGSSLIYKLQVIEPLDQSWNYQLDIQSDPSIELVSEDNEVYISVTENPCVMRAELIGNNTVKVYTENLLPGEYLVTKDYADDDTVYNIVIDEQGVGIFQLEDIGNSSYYYYYLKTLDNSDIDGFSIYVSNDNSRFECEPQFLSQSMTQIEDFYVEAGFDGEKPNISDIEYARVTQNGEIVANMSNFNMDGWYYSGGQVMIELYGNLSTVAGKTLSKGMAVFEIKYKNGYTYQGKIPVTDEATDLYGSFEVENSCYYDGRILGVWYNHAVGSSKVSFVIHNTNAATGKVALYSSDDDMLIEELELSELTKTTKYGYSNTYTGSFNTTLSSDKVYDVVFMANNKRKNFNSFTYYSGKLMEQYEELIAANGNCDIYLSDWINISNIKNISFKALVGDNEYSVPVSESYFGDNFIDFEADFSGVPVGYFTLKTFEGTSEIKMTNNTLGYNFGTISESKTTETGWHWENDKRVFCVYGVNLDKVSSAFVKVYKKVDFADASSEYNNTKLQYVKDIELAKPYPESYIAINNDMLSELETGAYTFVYMIDGVPAEMQDVYIRGNEPEYKAEINVNGGIAFTNKSNVDMAISYKGYTKMKIAFSEAELATASYEAIVTQKNISLEDRNGLVTLYVQVANDDESKTDIITGSITVDSIAPVVENVQIPEIKLWNTGEITFTTNEVLRNAFFVTGNENAESGLVEGRNYVFALQGAENGVYTYKCNFYADSQYKDISNVKTQIIAIDKAGNNTTGEVKLLNVSQSRNISGRITYADNGVPYTSVYLYKDENCVKYAYTNENGEFTFYDVAADDYSITVNKYGFTGASVSISKEDFIEDITNKDITLETVYSNNSAINISIKDYSGAAIQNAYVSVYSWDTDINLADYTNENGLATIIVPYQTGGTSYRVYASHSDYSKTDYITVDSDTEDVAISFPQKAVITGTAVKGEEKIANTEITISGNNYTTYAHTDENGAFAADVYLMDENKSFTVSANNNSKYSGSAEAVFEGNSLETSVTLNLKGNIRVKGSIKDNMAQPITEYSSISFNGNGIYQTVTPDANGEFETPDVFGVGTYTVYTYGSWPYKYETIQETLVITEEDLSSSIKELNLIGKKAYAETKFTTGKNGITATADIISKGDVVTVSTKFQNDGTSTLSDVVAYAKIPEGVDVKKTNGVKNDDGTVSKTVSSLKADETGTLTFTLDTDNYDDKALIVPAYVKVGNKEYPLGAITVQLVSVTLDAPQVVKENTAFKVSGEAVSGSTVEILNYSTKAVLATTDLTSKWYFADIVGLSEDTTLIAKVSKDGKIGYSQPVTVKVEANPITLKDVNVKWGCNLSEYGINENFGYPTLSIWEGYDFKVSTSFENMPENATVTYSFINKNNISTIKDGEYYNGIIKNWSGYGTKKVIATVTDGDNTYEFIVAELIILIDPSGYITDAETGKAIVGANVLLEIKSGSDWITWDATLHLQQNPMLTDEEGHYGWMVPEGEYRIIVTADGYETKTVEEYNSRDYGDNSKITVLPVRTDVDIKLTNSRAVEVDKSKTISVAGGRIKFVFTRPVDTQTVTNNNLKVIDSAGNLIEGSITLEENNTVVIFKPTAAMTNGNYKLSVANISDGNNNIIPAEEIAFNKATEIEQLANPTAAYNSTDGIITITFEEGKEPVNIEDIQVKQGDSVVSGVLRKAGNVVTFIPDAVLSGATAYKVIVPDAVRTASNNYLIAPYEYSFTTPGGGSNSPSGGGGGGSSVTSYKITVTQGQNGTISPDTISVDKNKSQSFTITPNEGYVIESVLVNGENVGAVSSYTFENVVKAGTITATFKKIEAGSWANPFGDVKENDWFYAAVKFAFEKGITSGVSENSYNPQGKVTRGEFITMLCRAYDISEMTGDNFADSGDTWYTGYLAAAKQLGISNGAGDNMFLPEKKVTREEMVTLIYNYLKTIDKVSDERTEADFADKALISDWAKTAVGFASENNIVKGKDNNMFDPQGTATRAELAQILYNLLNIA